MFRQVALTFGSDSSGHSKWQEEHGFKFAKFVVGRSGQYRYVRIGDDTEMAVAHFERLDREIGTRVERLGGGYLWFYPKEKRVYIGRRSVDYGKEPDRTETVRLLQESGLFPDCTVEDGN